MHKVIEKIVGGLMIALFILTAANVFLRYGFNYSLFGIEDLTFVLLVWTCFLGAIILQKDKKHFSMVILYESLSIKNKKRLDLINECIMIMVLIILLFASLKLRSVYALSVTQSLRLPKQVYAYAILIGVIGMLIYSTNHLLNMLKEFRKK